MRRAGFLDEEAEEDGQRVARQERGPPDDALEQHAAEREQVGARVDHILAARFLSRFVTADTPWVHVDLASSERKGGLAHVPTEFTGFGVRFATRLLGDLAFLARLAP